MAAKSGCNDAAAIGDQEWSAFAAEVKERDVGTQRAVSSVFVALVADAADNEWCLNYTILLKFVCVLN